MGLFGLFASLVGLGAMTKDAISNGIDAEDSRRKAIASGSHTYFAYGGKTYCTDVPGEVIVRYENGHRVVRDLHTNKFIVDETLEKNRRKESEERSKLPSGCVFYRKLDWDNASAECNVWVSNKVPGYFKHYPEHRASWKTVGPNSRFMKGELVDGKRNGWAIKEVRSNKRISETDYYFPNGELECSESVARRKTEESYNQAIAKGSKFYERYKPDNTRKSHWKYDGIYHIDSGEQYLYNKDREYYVKARETTRTVNVAKPHHEPVYEERKYYMEEPDGERFNEDGTKWYP